MKKNIVVGNWKMNLDTKKGSQLIKQVLDSVELEGKLEVIFAPSFIHIYHLAKICNSKPYFSIAAQNCSSFEKGAYTGEVAANMISSSGAKYVILGHSERRECFNEDHLELKKKVDQALNNNLQVIFCCGESAEERNCENHFQKIEKQLSESLFSLSSKQITNIIIAYEPIWSIGTGVTATPDQAQEMHAYIRSLITKKYSNEIAQDMRLLYGGSCNPLNAKDLFSQKDIDGGLIGGASLNPCDFISIINSF